MSQSNNRGGSGSNSHSAKSQDRRHPDATTAFDAASDNYTDVPNTSQRKVFRPKDKNGTTLPHNEANAVEARDSEADSGNTLRKRQASQAFAKTAGIELAQLRQDDLGMSRERLAIELQKIQEIANDSSQHYKKLVGKQGKMQLMILTNEDGTF